MELPTSPDTRPTEDSSSATSPFTITAKHGDNTSLNNCTDGPLGLQSELISWCIGYTLVLALTVVGNTFTLAVFCTHRNRLSMRRRRGNRFLFSLAVADLLVGVVCVPLYTTQLVASWTKGYTRNSEQITKIFLTVDVFCGFASVFTIGVIALERLSSVYVPHAHRHASATVYNTAVTTPWVMSAVLALLFLLSRENYLPFGHVFNLVTISLFLSLCVIGVGYLCTWIAMRCRSNAATQQRQNSLRRRTVKLAIYHRRQMKLAILTSIITLTFLVSWCPFQIINIIFYICTVRQIVCTSRISSSAVQFTKLLHYANSFMNPIIYSFRVPEFREIIHKTTMRLSAFIHTERRLTSLNP